MKVRFKLLLSSFDHPLKPLLAFPEPREFLPGFSLSMGPILQRALGSILGRGLFIHIAAQLHHETGFLLSSTLRTKIPCLLCVDHTKYIKASFLVRTAITRILPINIGRRPQGVAIYWFLYTPYVTLFWCSPSNRQYASIWPPVCGGETEHVGTTHGIFLTEELGTASNATVGPKSISCTWLHLRHPMNAIVRYSAAWS